MNAKEDKRQKSMKSKLIAAIAMLMVAVIMMVSTTYAWFTLSTAPEVTGITTAVGANGNLEMALVPTTGGVAAIESNAGDGALAAIEKNVTWGNLVDLSEIYGLERISLLPAALYEDAAAPGKVNTGGSMLSTPEYGNDGRVVKLQENTTTGTYDTLKTSFFANNNAGVRAVGVSSSMTPRKLALRNAISSAATYTSSAKTLANQSLSKNGGNLGAIAVEHYGSGTNTFTKEDAANLLKIVKDLYNEDGEPSALGYIDKAIGSYMVAVAASDKVTGDQDAAYGTIQKMVDEGNSVESIIAKLGEYGYSVTDSNITNAITKLATTKANVLTAGTKLSALANGESDDVAWTALYEAIVLIADVNQMVVAGHQLSDVTGGTVTKEKLIEDVMNEYLDKGTVSIVLNSGAGAFADIADFCGDYQATVAMTNISAAGITVPSVKAIMKTKTSMTVPYLAGMATFAGGLNAPDSGTVDMPMVEFYGYVIDLAFRTNAAQSNLLLQTTPTDRIYEGEGVEETMGHGSTMTFTASDETVTIDMMQNLMGCLRIVFFNPEDGEIYGQAGLTDFAAEGTGVKANIKLEDGVGGYLDEENATLMALTQNIAAPMSVLVYLDGETVTNAKVANALQTMAGSMNLQFSSSATLVPMQYADLMGQGTQQPDANDPAQGEGEGT